MYKVKYQNNAEIERTKISEVVVQEPVNKVIQVKSKTTNRSEVSRTETKTTENPASSSKSGLAAKVEGKTPVVKTMNSIYSINLWKKCRFFRIWSYIIRF